MLSIILTILKIIGIILLVILGLLFGLILLVLLVPIRYRASGSFYETLKGRAKITWLLHIFSITFVYEGQSSVSVRILGIPVGQGKRRRPKRRSEQEQDEDLIPEEEFLTVQSLPESREDFSETAGNAFDNTEKLSENSRSPVDRESFGHTEPQKAGSGNQIRAEQKERQKERQKAKRNSRSKEKRSWKKIWEKIRFSFRRFCDTLKNIKLNFEKVKSWIQDEENKTLVKLLYRQVRFFLRHILPRKIKGEVVFGFDDPYTTGEVLRYLSLVYPLCHKQLSVCPVFDRAVLEGQVSLKGHIRIGTALWAASRLLLNKRFRFLLKKFLR